MSAAIAMAAKRRSSLRQAGFFQALDLSLSPAPQAHGQHCKRIDNMAMGNTHARRRLDFR
ncbi:hypothetical protein PM082_010597 [Marasmius tenuissimus]|nr:hypothetical protein PM082_010597 [Marasmius tenuissimus]